MTELLERLGRLAPEVAGLAGRAPLWIHAASVGEVLSAEPLVERLRRQEPGRAIFLSTTSVTGRATARQRLRVPATLLPLDLPPLVARVLRRLRPAALVILETEIWPGLIGAAARAAVPVLFVSARITPGAAAVYARFGFLFRRALARVTAVAAQTEADAGRFIALGVPPERVTVLGSLKLAAGGDGEGPPCPVALGDRPVLVAASTQPGEEDAVLDACDSLWPDHREVLLVLAPRRPERFAEVAALLDRRGLSWSRRSAGSATVGAGERVLLLDTVGELARFFPGARAAFVGGTLAAHGGHNVLEPVTAGVPVAFGPHLENVREAADLLLACGGGVEVGDAAELARAWRDVLDRPEAARQRAEGARAELRARRRVADAAADLVRRHLRETP